jgi:hydroxypyruvate reductase
MPNLTQLRLAAREIFDEALRAVDAGEAVRRAVQLEGSRISFDKAATVEISESRNIYSIAIGKAAATMASALDGVLGNRIAAGLLDGNVPDYATARRDAGKPQAGMPALRERWQIFQGGHPEPNDQSLAAAQASFALLKHANEERALVIFLISGGGSAMIEWPINESITLADLRAANKALVNCGASISEINAVRPAFSAVKGGRLAARAPDCDQITLIVSDVPAGEERTVASGPTLTPPGDAPNALDVIARYNLRAHLPETILRALETESKPDSEPTSLREHFVLVDNQSALEAAGAAAGRQGFATEIAGDVSDQPIAEGCARLLSRLNSLHERAKTQESSQIDAVCLISGGEFACPVTGEGMGGRNLETALRLASARNSGLSESGLFVAVCAGTDGIDGNSPAAGAIVDNTTIQRARAIGLDPSDFLKRSDAYSFFVALGDAIATGATGTNVRDLRILLSTA